MPRGGARKGAGRPPGAMSDTATEKIDIRVTMHEKQAIQARAAARGMSVKEYILTCTLMGAP